MTLFGLDFSHYDAVPDGARVVSEGFTFMTHKAGGDANDAELAAWWKALKPYRDQVLLGAYWVLYPGSPTKRADWFLDRLDSQCGGWRDGPFILQVDCEKWNDSPTTVPSKNEIKAFCDRLVARMPKLKPIVYAPEWVYGNKLAGLGYPLWASRYVTGTGTASGLYPGDGSSKWDPYSGQTPAILQYTSSANALGQTTCDANAYRGTLAQLTALLAPGWVEDMALETGDIQDIWEFLIEDPYDEATPKRKLPAWQWLRYVASRNQVDPSVPGAVGITMPIAEIASEVEALTAAVAALSAKVDELSAQQLPANLAEQIADLLAARLES